MSQLPNLWLWAILLGAGMLAQWVVLRARYRSEIFKQRARHALQQQTTSQHFEQAKRQIAQLQIELATARLLAERHKADRPVVMPSRPRAVTAPRAAYDESATRRTSLPVDGFADTMPELQFPHDARLLTR